jgi:hypothetical protein
VAAEAGPLERPDHERDHLRVAFGRGRSDQLDPNLEELARLPASALRRAVGVGEVAQPERGLGLAPARPHHAGDRDRHVRAQDQDPPFFVEQPVAGSRGALVARHEHLLVLERRGPDLPVARLVEGRAQAIGDRADLAHLVGQDVTRARRGPPPDLPGAAGPGHPVTPPPAWAAVPAGPGARTER